MIQFNQDFYKFPSEFLYGVESNVEEEEYMESKKKKRKWKKERKESIDINAWQEGRSLLRFLIW